MSDPELSKRKTGPRPKKLVEATYKGIEVGRGENKKIIDPKQVEKLAGMGCKNSEISLWLDIDDSTLSYNFKRELIKGRSHLNQSLRMAQIKYALAGSVPLLIWLGKCYLGQSEYPENEDRMPELTQEQIDDRISKLLQINNDKSTTEHNGSSGQAGTNDAATTEGSQAQTQ